MDWEGGRFEPGDCCITTRTAALEPGTAALQPGTAALQPGTGA
jgi:hypothetical protein